MFPSRFKKLEGREGMIALRKVLRELGISEDALIRVNVDGWDDDLNRTVIVSTHKVPLRDLHTLKG